MDEIREESKLKAEEAKTEAERGNGEAEQAELEEIKKKFNLSNVSNDFLAMILRREERRKKREQRVWPYPRRSDLTTDDQRNIAVAEAKRERKQARNKASR